MDPFSIGFFLWLAAVVATTAVIQFIVFYTLDAIFSTFSQWLQNRKVNEDQFGFTLKEQLNNGNYRVYSGIFNTKTNKVETGSTRVADAAQLDSQLSEVHPTAFYNLSS